MHSTTVQLTALPSSFFSARPEVLYGRPALIALRSQRDSLHQLYRSYSNNDRSRTGVTGFNRQAFLKVGAVYVVQ